ncbi:unnamed protein product [Citrullus colocynthis]|uniref:Uncharacterized protein n=1 Tax=Citrullus colocynthis TaxID=252529 RepID=A0ABP0XSX2_9ROSI
MLLYLTFSSSTEVVLVIDTREIQINKYSLLARLFCKQGEPQPKTLPHIPVSLFLFPNPHFSFISSTSDTALLGFSIYIFSFCFLEEL